MDHRAGITAERLLAHYVAGAWRAPLSVRMLPVGVVAAGPADVQRARTGLTVPSTAGRGFTPPPGSDPDLPAGVVLLSAAAVPVDRLLPVLLAGARRGLIWKPAPGAAGPACALMRTLAPQVGAALALLHGDHASGALLAAGTPVIWASPDPAPPGLRVVFSVPATG